MRLHSSGTRENGVGDTHDLKGVSDDAHSHELLSVVAAVHHERVGETLNDGALCLAETLDGISASRVGDVDWLSDLDVIAVMFSSASILPLLLFPSIATAMRNAGPHPPTKYRKVYMGRTYVREMSRISTSS